MKLPSSGKILGRKTPTMHWLDSLWRVNLLPNHTATKNIFVTDTENRILEIISDYKDAIHVMSQYPECFEAYKNLIQKRRLGLQGGGLNFDWSRNSVTEVEQNGITQTSR